MYLDFYDLLWNVYWSVPSMKIPWNTPKNRFFEQLFDSPELGHFLSFLRSLEANNVSKTCLMIVKMILWCIEMIFFSHVWKVNFWWKKTFLPEISTPPQDPNFAILSKSWGNMPLRESRMASGMPSILLKVFLLCSATSIWPTSIFLWSKNAYWWTDPLKFMSSVFPPPQR